MKYKTYIHENLKSSEIFLGRYMRNEQKKTKKKSHREESMETMDGCLVFF